MSSEQAGSQVERRWRTRVALAFAFGAGVVVVLAILVGTILWWSSRPKSWDTQALRLSLRDLSWYLDDSGNPKTVVFSVTATNNTDADYRVSDASQLVVMLKTREALHRVSDAAVEVPVFIPPRQTAEIRILVPTSSFFRIGSSRDWVSVDPKDAPPAATRQSTNPRSMYDEAAALLPSELVGIAIYDEVHRYRAEIGKTW